jgi:two-component system sensor kinase FixL
MPSNELQAIMDAAVDAVILIDHRGTMTAFNRSAERLFGYTAVEAVGQNVGLLMPPSHRAHHDQYLERYAATGVAHIIGVGREVEALRKDGTVFPALLSVGRVADSVPARFVGMIRDITAEQQARLKLVAERDRAAAAEMAEQEARLLQERLMRVGRLTTLGEMAAGIAHELNQPLSAIATYARACERFLALENPDLEESRAATREIAQEALRAGAIIQRLRQFIASQTSVPSAVNLNLVIEHLTPLIMADARLHSVGITFDLDQKLAPLNGDSVQLQHLVLNLVRNAIEALSGNADPDRHIVIRTDASGSPELLSVCDNGPGVPPQMVNRLFMPFVTTKPDGTGLGLSISQTIARAHGGSVGYRPAEPRGACFFMRLAGDPRP